MPRFVGSMCLAILCAACGDNSSPTAPAPVIPNVQGVWTGDYQVSNCTDPGVPGACAAAGFTSGRVLPIRLTLNQNGQQLNGTAELGSFSVPVTGNINTAGRMVLGGTSSIPVNGIPTAFTLVNWDTVATTQNITGQWRTTISPTGISGNMIVDNTIRLLVKTG